MSLMTGDAAQKWIENRVSMPMDLSTSEYTAKIPAKVRANAFFSARVAESNVLEHIRGISDRYTSGEMTLAEARHSIREYVKGSGFSTAPKGLSKSEKEAWDQSANLKNIASSARVNLILRQQSLHSEAVGRYAEGRQPIGEKYFPCWRFRSMPDARASHAQWNGKVFLKSDPIWNRIFPPLDFNCRCWVEECTREEAGDALSDGSGISVPPPPSGYDFNPADAFECDMNAVKEVQSRKQILSTMREAVDAGDKKAFVINPARAKTPVGMVADVPTQKKIQTFIDQSLEHLKTPQELKALPLDERVLDLGSMSSPLKDAFGLETAPRFQIPLQGGNAGISHTKKNHAEALTSGLSSEIITRHLKSQDVKIALKIETGKPDYINITDTDLKTKNTVISTWLREKDSSYFKLVGAYEIYNRAYLVKNTITRGMTK